MSVVGPAADPSDQHGDELPILREETGASSESESAESLPRSSLFHNFQPAPGAELHWAAADEVDGAARMGELLHDQDTHIDEDILEAVAANKGSGKELLELLLRVRGYEVEEAISASVLVLAVKNPACGIEMIKLLLQDGDIIHGCLSYEVFEAAVEIPENSLGIMRLLLQVYEDRHDFNGIANRILAYAADDIERGEKIVEFILRECGDRVHMPFGVLKTIFQHYDHGTVAILLEKQAYRLWATEEEVMENALASAAQNIGSGAKIINMILRQYGDQVPIARSSVVEDAAQNEWCGKEILELLFLRCGNQIYITEATVRYAARNKRSGLEILELLICERRGEVETTEDVWKAAAENSGCGLDIVRLLLGQCCDEVRITEKLVEAAAQNNYGNDIMELFLRHTGKTFLITSKAICATMRFHDEDIVDLLFELHPVRIPSKALEAATNNRESGRDILQLLLRKYGDKVWVTAAAMQAAFRNVDNGHEIAALLLRERPQEIKITSKMADAIARNPNLGEEFMELVLRACGDNDYVADRIVETAAKYGMVGVLIRVGAESERVCVAKRVIEVAASCSSCEARRLEPIFYKHHDQTLVTPKAMEAAASNSERGMEMMELFLRCYRDKVTITERVLEAALRNSSQGSEIIKLFLTVYGDEIQISERLVNTAAQYSFRGTVIRLLLRATTNLVTPKAIESAARNSSSAAAIMELLLAIHNGTLEITERTSESVAHHPQTGEDMIKPLAQRHEDDIRATTIASVEAAILTIGSNPSILKQLAREHSGGIQITETMVKNLSYHDPDVRTEIMNILLHDFTGEIHIPAETLQAFAGSYDEKTIENLLRTQRDNIRITKEVVEAAATNKWHGEGILKLLLAEPLDEVPITETAIEHAVRQYRGSQLIELFLEYRPDDVVMTTSIVQAATTGGDILADGLQCTRLLLHRGNEMIEITETMIEAATRGGFDSFKPRSIIGCLLREIGGRIWISPKALPRFVQNFDAEMIGLLLETLGAKIQITEEVVIAALKHGQDVDAVLTKVLAANVVDANWFTEKAVEVVSRMWHDKQKTLAQLIRRCAHVFRISENTVSAIARSFDQHMMALLLETQGGMLPITESVLVAVAQNTQSAPHTMYLLLQERVSMVSISDAVVKAAIENFHCGGRLLRMLLERRGDEIRITENHVISAAGVSHYMLQFLLRERPGEVHINEAVLVVVARNEWAGEPIVKLLLPGRTGEMEITGRVLEAAASNTRSGEEILKLLLQNYDDEIPIGVVEAAAGNTRSGTRITSLLFQEREHEIQITEKVVTAAARNPELGEEILELLFQKRRGEIQVTASMMQAAMGNPVSSEQVMEILLHHCDDDFQMDPTTAAMAAANLTSGRALMEQLLHRLGAQVQPTEDVLEAAAQNDKCGFDIVEMLLLEHADTAHVTTKVVKAALRNERCGLNIIELLLHERCHVRITEEMIVAAVESQHATRFLTLLLDKVGSSQITDRVVESAARNASHGKEIMRLLVDKYGEEIPISEDVKRATAEKSETGGQIMELLPSTVQGRTTTEQTPTSHHPSPLSDRIGVDSRAENRSDILDAMRNFASVSIRQKKYAAAEQIYQLMLERREDALGREHALALQIMDELVQKLYKENRYKEAERICREKLRRREISLGQEHVQTLENMEELALILHKQWKYAEREEMLRNSLTLRGEMSSQNDPDTTNRPRSLESIIESWGVEGRSKWVRGNKIRTNSSERLSRLFKGPKSPDTRDGSPSLGSESSE